MAEREEPTSTGLDFAGSIAFRDLVDAASCGGRISAIIRSSSEVGSGTMKDAAAWLSSSRHDVHRSLRIPGLRKGDDSPLRTRPAARLRYDPEDPPLRPEPHVQIRSPPCADASSTRSSDVATMSLAVAHQRAT